MNTEKLLNANNQYIEELLNRFEICSISKTAEKKGRKYTHPISKKGNYIYILLNKDKKIIYIGETGTSVTHRLYSDGSGAHKNKSWFDEVDQIKYLYFAEDDISWQERVAIESILVLKYKPVYNLSKRKQKQ